MCELMYFQITLLCEQLITHIIITLFVHWHFLAVYSVQTELYASQKYGQCQQHNSKYLFRTLSWQIIYYAHHMSHCIRSYNSAAWMTYYRPQLKGWSPLCMHSCAFRLPCCVKSPQCMHSCAFRLSCCVNNLLHTSQVNGCSPLCVCVDVPSDDAAMGMIYYTHWSCILASHQTDYSALQMLYYNIRTIHVMYGFVFKQNILLRDQRELH